MARLYERGAAKGLLYALAIIGTIVFLRIAKTRYLLNTNRPTEASTDVAMPRSNFGNWYSFVKKERQKPQCYKKGTNITFLKTHKTASSRVQNILMRYGNKHNLSFVLPPRSHFLGYPKFFDSSKHMIRRPALPVYNIFCHHTRFDYQAINNLMPPDTVYVTIVRSPAGNFESSFAYFRIGEHCGYLRRGVQKVQWINIFLENPAKCLKTGMVASRKIRNPLFHDLGLNYPPANPEVINREVLSADKKFDLVLITEYFDESLILLKNLLCWEFEDIIYFKLNSRDQSSVSNLTSSQRQKIREWNKADWVFYDHFNRSLWQKIREYGEENMRRDVEILRRKNDLAKEKCLKAEGVTNQEGDFKVFQPKNVKMNNFKLKEEEANGNQECVLMVMPESLFTKYLRNKQYPTLKTQSIVSKILDD